MKRDRRILITGMIVCAVLLSAIVLKKRYNSSSDVIGKILGNSDVFCVEELFPVAEKPEETFANQGFAVYGDILFQLYNDNKAVLSDLRDHSVIAQLDITSLHGDTIDFSDEFIHEEDEFPLAYITADTNPAKVFAVRIDRSSTELIRTYSFDEIEETGYYAGHCLDAENHILYMVGYLQENYYDPTGNSMIVSVWDLDHCTENEDGSFRPELTGSFRIPFIITVQGQRYYEGKLYLLSSHTGSHEIGIDTRIYVVDPKTEKVERIYDQFPENIKRTECEGIEFVNDGNAMRMIISTYNASGGKYYEIKPQS